MLARAAVLEALERATEGLALLDDLIGDLRDTEAASRQELLSLIELARTELFARNDE